MNILVVSSEDLTKPSGGASNRAYHLAKALKKVGNTVIVLQSKKPANRQDYSDDFEIHTYLQRIGKRELYFFNDINPFFVHAIAKLVKQRHIDIIQVEQPWGVIAAYAVSRLARKEQKVVYNSQNVQATVQNELARSSKTEEGSGFLEVIIAHLLAINTQIIEGLAARLSDIVLCVSSIDKRAFMNMYGIDSDKITLVPNGTSLQKAQSASRNKELFGLDRSKLAIVFHGTYMYAPNREAIRCIRNSVAPYFKRHSAEVEFVVAGNEVPRCEFDNVRCLGFVDDIYTLLKSSDIAIVPLKSGGGTRLKILDYFAAGLPVVTTEKGIEGIEASDQVQALIVNKTGDFIRALMYLIDDAKERERISANAFKLVKSLYDWDVIGESLNRRYLEFDRQYEN